MRSSFPSSFLCNFSSLLRCFPPSRGSARACFPRRFSFLWSVLVTIRSEVTLGWGALGNALGSALGNAQIQRISEKSEKKVPPEGHFWFSYWIREKDWISC